MSVFQLEDWWSHHISNGTEEFDIGCFAVGNVDNASPESNKIVIGSHQGILRIFNPTRPKFRVDDLLLEESLQSPILQLCLGFLVPAVPDQIAIAVLHPRKVVVYEVIPKGCNSVCCFITNQQTSCIFRWKGRPCKLL